MALACAALLLGACGTPRYRVSVEPEDARLFLDGRRRPETRLEEPIPYYGVMRVDVLPPDVGRRAESAALELPVPVTRWLFPVDFVIEMARLPFVGDPVPAVAIELPPRAEVPEVGFPAAHAAALRRRALEAEVER